MAQRKQPVICPDCGKEFKDGRGLMAHRRFKHADMEAGPVLLTTTEQAVAHIDTLERKMLKLVAPQHVELTERTLALIGRLNAWVQEGTELRDELESLWG